MSFGFGTPVESSVTAASTSVTLTSVPAGAELVTWATWNNSTVTLSSVNDSIGGALTLRGPSLSSSSTGAVQYTLDNAAAGSHTITFTFSASSTLYVAGLYVSGTSGVDVATGQDSNFVGTGANAVTSGNMTTTTSGDAILGFFWTASGGGVVSAGTSPNTFTTLGLVTANAFAEQALQSGSGSVAANGTSSINSDILALALALKAAGSTSPTLMGQTLT